MIPEAARDHFRCQADAILLAHMKPATINNSADQGRPAFTCNMRVTASNTYSNTILPAGVAPTPHLPVMNGLSCERARTGIPTKALTFLVNRCVGVTL